MGKFYWLVILFFTLIATEAKAQFGNEWIDYSQKYYAFDITADGIYRLNHSTLINQGINTNSFSSSNIQIFGKEKEIPIHVVDGGDNSFDIGDYILFYAERNNGWLDSTLYPDPNSIGSPGLSLYNDTLTYFFTWNNSTNNLRYSVETDTDFASYTPSPFVMSFFERTFTNAYYEGQRLGDASSSFFVPGEGWGAGQINGANGATQNHTLTTSNLYSGPGAPNAFFNGLSISNSSATTSPPNSFNHHMRWRIGSSQTVINDQSFQGYQQIRTQVNVSPALLSNGNTPLYFDVVGDLGALTDYQAVTYYSIEYPMTPNFGNAQTRKFKVVNSGQGKIRLNVTGVALNNPIVFVMGDTPRIVPFINSGGTNSMLIPNAQNGTQQEVFFSNETAISEITSLETIGTDGSFTNYSSGLMDSILILVYNDQLKPASEEYADYRQSLDGGSHNVLLANVDELYYQFGGGVKKHINGIRRLAAYIDNETSSNLAGLFLMGKGFREATLNSFTSDGPGYRFDPTRYEMCLIPSFGHPSSDVAITASLTSNSWTPICPTGRISVQSNQELLDYLNKVKQYELQQDPNDIYNSPNKAWQKEIMHFAGGSQASEQALFQSSLNSYKVIVEDSLFGGNVSDVFKTSSDPLDPTVLDGVTSRIEEGVSVMTYFGHNSANTSGFEINLDEPTNWNNTGKYPLMIVNSCYNGNLFQFTPSKSEEFVSIANFGAIGYISSTATGYSHSLTHYTRDLYREFSNFSYGKPIGFNMMKAIQSQQATYGSSLFHETTSSQMVLNGDPMIKVNSHPRPEIELTQQGVWFTPEDLNLTIDSIEMHIVLTNLGQSVTTPFSMEVVRNFPDGGDSVYVFQFDELHFRDTFSFKMPLQANVGIGINNFEVSVDLPSFIAEQYDEINNNRITVPLFLDVDGIIPVIPYDFAVVSYDTVTVKASTINPISSAQTYLFQLDTTDLYNSPEFRQFSITDLGGIQEVHWSEWLNSSGVNTPLICEDSTVYFWRVALEDSDPEWREHSFQYIVDKEGWGQDHFFQFKKNNFVGIDYNRPDRLRNFNPESYEISCRAFSSTAVPTIYQNNWSINEAQQEYGIINYAPKFHVGVVDPVSFESWGTKFTSNGITSNPNNNFGNANNEFFRVMKYFTFYQNNAANLASFCDMINTEIPDSFYVVIYSPFSTSYDQINAIDSVNVYSTFHNHGATGFTGNNVNAPFGVIFKKGNPNMVAQYYASPGEDAFVSLEVEGKDSQGLESSPLIGPSSEWKTIYWKQDPEELNSSDSTRLRIRAFDINQNFQQELDTVFSLHDSILNLNALVDAAVFPFIQLEAFYEDDSTFTPAQIDHWHVLFSPLPEAAIDGSNGYYWSHINDTLNAGENAQFAVDVRNIFTLDMDSLLVNYWVEDGNQGIHPINYPRQEPLLVDGLIRDTVTINTSNLSGLNTLWMEVNPFMNSSTTITDQPEQEHFNNLLQLPFFVATDDKNPILDVTFNGRHILNGDIVDPNSEILISLKDDNEYLVMDNVSDTALFGIYLTSPDGVQKRIPFVDAQGNTVMQWIPAEAQHKRFKIIWPSEFKQDGTYELFVQGSDRSGNLSGDMEYRVSFEIILESTITHMMNYPNPFSTSTRFVFTLTGSEEPDDILIQILSVTGKVVREINEDEIGPIHIGRNITEFAWDGTDEFGDPLANGVYLYRVQVKLNGETMKHRESGADKAFEKNFGKMYLMR